LSALQIVSGGGDTSRGALIYMIFELARHPVQFAKLRAELDKLFKDKPFNFDGGSGVPST
jgi:cytochrome P450